MTPAVRWPLHNCRPVIQIVLNSSSGQAKVCSLVADTGAGGSQTVFELILQDRVCLQFGGIPMGQVQLAGAYTGSFPIYLLEVCIPQLSFTEPVPTVGVPGLPAGFDGIAGFKFLNRFNYGNFGDPMGFGIETLPTP